MGEYCKALSAFKYIWLHPSFKEAMYLHPALASLVYLWVALETVQFPDPLLQLPLQHQRHPVEELEGGVAAEPLHALDRGELHGVVLALPAVVVDLGLDEGVRVAHHGGGRDVLGDRNRKDDGAVLLLNRWRWSWSLRVLES